MPKRAALFYDYPAKDGDVYGEGRRERLEQLTRPERRQREKLR